MLPPHFWSCQHAFTHEYIISLVVMQLNFGSKKKETTEMARQTDQLNHKV